VILPSRNRWALLLLPIALRLVLVPFVADFEADAYSRMLSIESLADALRQQRPLLAAMYIPVWPPAWHLVCAVAELGWPNAYLVPKVLAALFGGATPLLVWSLARRLAGEREALWAWLIVAVAPLEVLYATSGMSEAFYGFWFVLAALAYLRADRGNAWLLVAAAALVPAALSRFDGWILLPALAPMAWAQRRASVLVGLGAWAIAAIAPLGWLALDWRVAGRPLAFLAAHGAYLEHFYRTYNFHALYHDRGPLGWAFHAACLVGTMGLFTLFLGVREAVRGRNRGRDARALALFIAVAFGWLLLMWIFRRQMGWRRHYLALGACLAPFAAIALCRLPRRRAMLLLGADLLLVLATSAPFTYVPRRFAQAASFLRGQPGRVYTDEPGVRLLLGDRARIVSDAPPHLRPDELEAWLRAREVRWVVFSAVDYSPLGEELPWMRDGESRAPYALAFHPPSSRPPLPRLEVYQLTDRPPASP